MNDIFRLRKKQLNTLLKLRNKTTEDEAEVTCPKCGSIISAVQHNKKYKVCIDCGYHFSLNAIERMDMVADAGTFKEVNGDMFTKDPLAFPGYLSKLGANSDKTGMKDAVLTGVARIDGIKACVAVLDSNFLMGSMGTVVGEKITYLTEYAGKKKLPLIIFSASGGARMQEGLFSLMQMAKTSAAVEKFKLGGGLFISVLTNPTTGGVSASYANLGDIIIAEPDALICFAGPRVIEQTIGQKLPEGFQRSEFLLEHGMIDMVVERAKMKNTLARLLKMHQRG